MKLYMLGGMMSPIGSGCRLPLVEDEFWLMEGIAVDEVAAICFLWFSGENFCSIYFRGVEGGF